MQAELFDLDLGRSNRDTAMARALAAADNRTVEWASKAFFILEAYASFNERFLTEDVRQFAHQDCGLPLPPDGRAWGGIIQRGVREGMLIRDGFAPMKSPNCHANPKSVWVSQKRKH